MARQALNSQSKAFCEEYVANGYKAVEAYMIAYPNSSRESAYRSSSKVLLKPEIKQYIKEIQRERFEALNISADRIACELSAMAFCDFDQNNTATSKLKALDLLQKQLGLQSQKVEMNGKQDIVINIGGLDDGENQEQTGEID